MKNYVRVVLIIHSAIYLGCGNALRVRTNPENANVYLISPKTSEKKLFGQAPLDLKTAEVSSMLHMPPSSREFLLVLVEKKDFESKQFLVPLNSLGAFDTHLDVKLNPIHLGPQNSTLVVQYLLNAQELLNAGDLSRADLEIERAIQLDPLNPWPFVMRGHILLIKKDYKNSLAAYEKSLELEPSNQEVLKRVVDVRKFLKETINENK